MADESIDDILSALERNEAITLAAVADALAKRWPDGVVIAVLQRREQDDTTAMDYAWRKSFYSALGMVSKLEMIMMNEGEEEDFEE